MVKCECSSVHELMSHLEKHVENVDHYFKTTSEFVIYAIHALVPPYIEDFDDNYKEIIRLIKDENNEILYYKYVFKRKFHVKNKIQRTILVARRY